MFCFIFQGRRADFKGRAILVLGLQTVILL